MFEQVGNTPVNTLVQLNAALRRLGQLNLAGPPAAAPVLGAAPAPAPAPYVLPLRVATFAPPSTAAQVDGAIAESDLALYDYMTVQEVVDEVNAGLAQPPAPPAPAAPPPPAAITFDYHGHKHFGGAVGVPSGGDQWSLGIQAAQTMMIAAIRNIEPHLRAHDNPNVQGVKLYYYTTNAAGNVGRSEGRNTSKYTIQIDYNAGANTVQYHGYPDKAAVALGLGYGKNAKQWNV